jgi:hypothetical protein
MLNVVVTLAEIRPWGGSDDPGEYAALPVDWPHDARDCPACMALYPWRWAARAPAMEGADRGHGDRRAASEAFAHAYPNRFRSVAQHRRQVRAAAKVAPERAQRVRAEGVRFLVTGLAMARAKRLIPSRWTEHPKQPYDGPWPDHWPCVEIGKSDCADGFVQALRDAYPDRFPHGSAFPFADPHEYAAAFIRAVIADAIRDNTPLRANSAAVRSLLNELHRLLSKRGQTFASLWLIDDVDFTAVDGQIVNGIVLRAPKNIAQTVSSLFPEAWWASWPHHGASAYQGGLLFAMAEGVSQHWDTTDTLNLSIRRIVDAIHLATGSTGFDRTVWLGEPSMIHLNIPEAQPQTELGIVESPWRRVAKVTPADLAGLSALGALLAQAQTQTPNRGGQPTVPSLAIAVGRYRRSLTDENWRDAVFDLAIALEAALPGKEKIETRLRNWAAWLLADDGQSEAATIRRDIKHLYDLRSDLIHGNARYERTPAKMCEERGFAQTHHLDPMWPLLDSWRDIVRRVICARLLLADIRCGDALWPLIGGTAVQATLADPKRRSAWRQRLAEESAVIGLPRMIEPAQPLANRLDQPRLGTS